MANQTDNAKLGRVGLRYPVTDPRIPYVNGYIENLKNRLVLLQASSDASMVADTVKHNLSHEIYDLETIMSIK